MELEIVPNNFCKWLEMLFVVFPASIRRGVHFPIDLVVADCSCHQIGLMKIKAGFIPLQFQEINNSSGLKLLLLNHGFVVKFENWNIQRLLPMFHDLSSSNPHPAHVL